MMKNTILLILLLFCFATFSISQSIIFTPDEPVIEEGIADSIIVHVDVSEEIKNDSLQGRGNIEIRAESHLLNATPKTLSIPYDGGMTIPDHLLIKPSHFTIAENDYFYETVRMSFKEAPFGESDPEDKKVFLRGSYFDVAKAYLIKNSAPTSWIGYSSRNLIFYKVPEAHFDAWYKTLYSPTPIAFTYQMGLTKQYFRKKWAPNGATTKTIYELRERGWKSVSQYVALTEAYREMRETYGYKNFTFSRGERVPIDFFVKKYPEFEALGINSGEIDHRIAALYNKKKGKRLLRALGFDAKDILSQMKKKLGLINFAAISPRIIGKIGQLISAPNTFEKEKPLALFITTQGLSEGTFSEKRLISSLAQAHRLLVAQVSSKRQLLKVLEYVENEFNSKANIVVFDDHGGGYGISFFRSDDTEVFDQLNKVTESDATVFLSSCATAEYLSSGEKAFAYIISESLQGRTIFAGRYNTSGQYLNYYPKSVNSSDKYRVFMNNTPVITIKDGIEIELNPIVTNSPPAVVSSIAYKNAMENVAFSFRFKQNVFSDREGDSLQYSATLSDDGSLPAWLTFTPETRTFSGTPTQEDIGVYNVKLTAHDGAHSASDVFRLTVRANNRMLLLSELPETIEIEANQTHYLEITNYANDIDSPEDSLKWIFSVSNDSVVAAYDVEKDTLALTADPQFAGTVDLFCTVTNEGDFSASDTIKITVNTITGLNELSKGIPTDYELQQNFPNPFNPNTTIVYALPKAGDVKITLYNIMGQRVGEIYNGYKTAGHHKVKFDASHLASGNYFYLLESKGFSKMRKMLLLK
jgi:hypothetical protein